MIRGVMLEALAVLLALQLIGELLVLWLGLPLPGPLLAMVLLLSGLVALGRVPRALGSVCDHLMRHLMLLFVPAVAGVVMYSDRVAGEWLAFVAAVIGGAALTIVVTALSLRRMLRNTAEGRH